MRKLFNIFSSIIAYISYSTLFAEGDKSKAHEHWGVPDVSAYDASTETEEERLARETPNIEGTADNPNPDAEDNTKAGEDSTGGNELTEEEAALFTENVNKLIELGYTEEEVKQLAQGDIDKILNNGRAKEEVKEDIKGEDKEADTPETVYKFSDKVQLPESKVAEIAAKTRDEFGGEDFDKLPDTVKFKLVQKDINIYEGSRNLSQKNQEAATARKDIAAERAKIDEERAKLDKQIKEIEEQKKKDEETLEQNLEDVLDVDDKITLALEQKEAKVRLDNTDTKLIELKDKTTKLQTTSAEIVVNDYITQLMQANPELQTTLGEDGRPRNPIEIFDNPKKYAGTDDLKRSIRLSDVITKYLQSGKDTGLPIDEWYEMVKDVIYSDLKLKNTPAQTGSKPVEAKFVDVKKMNTAQLLKDIFEKAKNSPPNPRGRTSDGNSTVNLQQKESSAQKKKAIENHWVKPSGTTGN